LASFVEKHEKTSDEAKQRVINHRDSPTHHVLKQPDVGQTTEKEEAKPNENAS
jgi:hypothetical protein